MHEYSLAEEVIRIAQSAAEKNDAVLISEITIEAGKLSGVDPEAFEQLVILNNLNGLQNLFIVQVYHGKHLIHVPKLLGNQSLDL